MDGPGHVWKDGGPRAFFPCQQILPHCLLSDDQDTLYSHEEETVNVSPHLILPAQCWS